MTATSARAQFLIYEKGDLRIGVTQFDGAPPRRRKLVSGREDFPITTDLDVFIRGEGEQCLFRIYYTGGQAVCELLGGEVEYAFTIMYEPCDT